MSEPILDYDGQQFHPDEVDDCRIMQATLKAAGHDYDLTQLCRDWQSYSDSVCAGWIRTDGLGAPSILAMVEDGVRWRRAVGSAYDSA